MLLVGCGTVGSDGSSPSVSTNYGPPTIHGITPAEGVYPGGSMVVSGTDLISCHWYVDDRECQVLSWNTISSTDNVEIEIPRETVPGTKTLKVISGWWQIERTIIVLQP